MKKHTDTETPLKAWRETVESASWKTPQDVKNSYSTASVIGNNRVVFNIKGNRYRLVVKMHYNTEQVFVRFIGTHEEYNGINAEEC